ncbi:MAG: hypothetical protein SGI92_05460 [Bryobacteraceae bacterium]|nr:hypothetical protein [Bryobacteraceae bacterium]
MSTATPHDVSSISSRPAPKPRAKKLSVALLAPDGVALRNFVVNNYVTRHFADVTIFHNCPADVPQPLQRNVHSGATWQRMPPMREQPLSFTLRQTLTFAHLYWGDTSSMRFTRTRPMGGSWKTRAANHAGRIVGRIMAHQPGIQMLERAYFRSVEGFPEVEHYRKLFQANRPDVVLSGSHRAPAVLAPVLAAKSLGIPVVTFVASWDNLTSKSRVAAPFDHYLVWSDLMRRELLQFYPHVRPDQATIVGTPQFDCYADPDILLPRAEFFRRWDLDLSRPLICFSGGDAGNCPQDPEHIEIIMTFIRNGRIKGNPQMVVRPMPVDDGRRYEGVRRQFPELRFCQPAWDHLDPGDWSRCVPRPEDVQFLANITQHADLNVNNGSTMTLDYSLHDRPVVNLCFDVGEVLPGRLPLFDYYNWDHYRPILKFKSARFSHSADQLADNINFVLDHPEADREGRQKLVDLQVGHPPGSAGPLIAEALQKVIANA